MRFSNGVYAQVTLKADIKEDSGCSHYFYDSQSVYDFLIDHLDHDIAAEAESWTELAGVGEWYETDDFEIEMMEV
jgi:hypothetical protein